MNGLSTITTNHIQPTAYDNEHVLHEWIVYNNHKSYTTHSIIYDITLRVKLIIVSLPHSSYVSLCDIVFYCTFVFLYNIVSGQLALLLLINNNDTSYTPL